MDYNRRDFVKQGAAGVAAWSAWPGSRDETGVGTGDLTSLRNLVKFRGDGPSFTPPEYVAELQALIHPDAESAGYFSPGVSVDYYSRGGPVERLERKMADLLGKEFAVYLPTGTLANHLALRILAKGRKVLVQNDSHIYNDCGDCAQVLSNLNLVPLAHDSATFSLEDVQGTVARTASGRVTTGVGVVMIESPMRRRRGELFDYDTMRSVCAYARDQGIATHLDGARLFMASGYTGISPAEYSSHFDTVYVSLWKYFNAPSGAILAGPRALLEDLYHERRMFGGGLPHAWPFALVAERALAGFEERFKAGVDTAERLFRALDQHEAFGIERVPNGTNIFELHVKTDDRERFRKRLLDRGVMVGPPVSAWEGFVLTVNETVARMTAPELMDHFTESL